MPYFESAEPVFSAFLYNLFPPSSYGYPNITYIDDLPGSAPAGLSRKNIALQVEIVMYLV